MKVRRPLLVLVGLTGLVFIVVVAWAASFDLNAWKPEIEEAISKATRMEVTIQGTIERSRWFPLSVVAHGLQFRNEHEPVLSIATLECSSLELIPLIRRRLRMGTCFVDGFAIAIVKGADGSSNYERSTPKTPRPPGDRSATPPPVLVSRMILRNGRYTYADRDGPTHAEIAGIRASLDDFAIAKGGTRRAFSFKGAIACDSLQRDRMILHNLWSKVAADGGRFSLDDLSLDAFGAKGTGAFTADTSEKPARFELSLQIPECRIERLLPALRAEPIIGGPAALAMSVSAAGHNSNDLTKTLTGEVSLSGESLRTYDLDVDKLIKKFDKTRGFNLFDFAAFFVAGPMGPIATKGFDFGRVYKELGTGEGQLDRLVTKWTIADGMAEAKDCALATSENRLAFGGKIDLNQGVYQDAAIAVLDERGCSRYTEKLSGPVGGKRDIMKSTAKMIAGPFIGLYQKIHHALDEKCDPFYSGSVAHPRERDD